MSNAAGTDDRRSFAAGKVKMPKRFRVASGIAGFTNKICATVAYAESYRNGPVGAVALCMADTCSGYRFFV